MIVLHVISGLGDGGAEAVLYRLCKYDSSAKYITVSLMNEGKYGSLLKEEGIEVFCLNLPAGRVSLLALWRLYRFIKFHKPDVVQTWMYHADLIGGVVAQLAGVRNIFWGVHHTTLVKGESKCATIMVAKLNALLSTFIPKRIIYCAQQSRVVQESIGFAAAKGVVVPNGYNIQEFDPSSKSRLAFRNELEVQDIFLIGHVGRFHNFKDYPNLISSIGFVQQQNKDFKVALVGTDLDERNNELLCLIDNNAHIDIESFQLLGRREDISSVMNGFDIFILSSSSEAFSNVLNEAMACGTPCVTTDVGDAAVIVGETGWVVPPKAPQALANAILKAIEEKENRPQVWQARKQACRRRIVENFSIEKMIENYHHVWSGD